MQLRLLERLQSEYGIFALEQELSLPSLTIQEIRYGRGFLRADYRESFKSLLTLWIPVFSAAEAEVKLTGIDVDFSFPTDLEAIYSFRVNDEVSIIGLSAETQQNLASLLLESEDRQAGAIIADYLVRRFIYTLAKAIAPDDSGRKFSFIGAEDLGEVEIEGHLKITLATEVGELQLHIGLGPEFLQGIDQFLRRKLLSGKTFQSKKLPLVVEIADVPEGLLVGNLEPGIWLGTDLATNFSVRVIAPDGQSFQGKLSQFNGRFAVESLGFSAEPAKANSVRLEIARGDVTEEDLFLMGNPGAIFLTKTIISSTATLTKGDKILAPVTLAELGGRLVFRIEENVS